MKQINKNLLLIILMSMIGIKIFAYDIAVKNNDGVTIYYNYINNGKELAVAPENDGTASYQEDVIYNIPQSVTIEGTEYPVTKIEEGAFLKSKVVFLTIPEGIKTIGKDAFSQCAQLKSVKIPDSVTGELNCFYGCEMLTSIEIGENITKIGNSAFRGCKKLEIIVFPDKVAEVDVRAFIDCNSLTTLSFGSGISKFSYTGTSGVSRWQNCNSLNKIIIRDLSAWCRADFVDRGNNPIYKAGYIYSDENTRIKNLIIPNGISSIKDGSFYGCIGIESVTIPNSVTKIEDFAFYGSKNIKKIIFGKSVNYIGRDNYRNCTNLGTIICMSEIPPSLYHESVFYESKNINLFVPKGCVSAYKESTWSSVAKNISELSSVTLDMHEVSVNAGETFQLNASIYPIYDINKPLVWTSSNEDVVTVDENGLVKAHKAGTAKVTTLLQSYMDTIDECEVTVIQPVTGIQLSETKVTMSELGEMKQLVATVLPEDASNKAVTWMSSDPSVCSVTSNGTIVAMGYGTTTIMATTVDGGFPAVCVVQVASYVVGDINGDDKVDVSDYTGIANFIHGNPPAGFNEKAADVDKNGTVDVSDYTGIANIIHTGSIYGSSSNSARATGNQPTADWYAKDNVIFIAPFTATAGTKTSISIEMKNTAAIRGFQFDLYLPEGMTVVKSAKGKIQGKLSEGRLPDEDEHDLTFSQQPDGAIRFLCSSQYDETFTGTSGELATLQVEIASDMANGEYAIQLKNMKLTETDISKYYTSDLIESTVTIGGESSGIIVINNEQLTNDNEAGAWYTIDGRRLTSKPAKSGLYIKNGKKVVIK